MWTCYKCNLFEFFSYVNEFWDEFVKAKSVDKTKYKFVLLIRIKMRNVVFLEDIKNCHERNKMK